MSEPGICACTRGEAVVRGMCRACWAAHLAAQSRRYVWTPALRTELRAAYALPKKARAAALAGLQRKTGWPAYVLRREARRLDIVSRRWTAKEDSALMNALGDAPITMIAQGIGRTHEGVKMRARRLRASRRVREGFCLNDLVKIFGAPRYRVEEWAEKGLFGRIVEVPGAGSRVSDTAVTRFIKSNPELIDFRRADQTFLKGVLYGA